MSIEFAARPTHADPESDLAGALLAQARDLVPDLQARAVETNILRRLPDASISDLKASGLFRVLQPAAYGGHQADYVLFSKLARTLAHGCGSTAWVFSVYSEHNWVISQFPKDAQDEVWGPDPTAVASSSLAPVGKAVAVPGGFKLSGRWAFSSGSDHAQWVLVGGMVQRDDAIAEERIFLIPRREVEGEGEWRVLGLIGTGSRTLVGNDLFVPAHRAVPMADIKAGRAPGAQVHPGYDMCRAPRALFATFSLSSVVLGLGERAVELFIARTSTRNSRGTKIAELQAVQLTLAEASAEIESAGLLTENTCARNTADLAAERPISVAQLAWTRRNAVYSTRLSYNATQRVFKASGGSALIDDTPIQIVFRDVVAGSNHLFLGWDQNAQYYGRCLLGLPVEREAI